MSMMLRTVNGDLNLGGSIEFLRFVSELGRAVGFAKADGRYPRLLGILDLNEEEQDEDSCVALAEEAEAAIKEFPGLSEHSTWVLTEIAGMVEDEG